MPSDAFFQRKGTAARLAFAAESFLLDSSLSSEDRKFYRDFIEQRLKQALLLLLSRKNPFLLEQFLSSFKIPVKILQDALLAFSKENSADSGCCGLLL